MANKYIFFTENSTVHKLHATFLRNFVKTFLTFGCEKSVSIYKKIKLNCYLRILVFFQKLKKKIKYLPKDSEEG